MRSRQTRRRASRGEARAALLFLLPCLTGLAVFMLYPLAANLYYSFTNFNLLNTAEFIGLRNYQFMFQKDDQFWQAVRNTVLFTVIAVPLQIVWAILVSLLVTSVKRGSSWYRTLFYLPALLPPVAATMGFALALHPSIGLVNRILGSLGLPKPLWLFDENMSMWVFIAMVIWAAGNTIVVVTAGILDVPRELYEAAMLDGSNRVQRFFFITLPSLRPVLIFTTVTGLIGSLQLFTQPFVANGITAGSNNVVVGAPNGASLYYTTWIYQQAFSFFHAGYASALSTVLLVVSMIFTLVVLRIGRFTEEP